MEEKKLNITGLVLLFISTVVIGCVLSAVYLLIGPYLQSISVYFAIFLAIAFGAATGGLAGLMIKFFKIDNAKQAFAVVLIGCIIFTYFKWSLYIKSDAEIYLDFYLYYDDNIHYDFANEDGEPLKRSKLESMVADMQDESAYDYWGKDTWEEFNFGQPLDADIVKELKADSHWEYFEYNVMFGDKPEEAVSKIQAYFKDPFSFQTIDKEKMYAIVTEGYVEDLEVYNEGVAAGQWDYPSAIYFVTHPQSFMNAIGGVNADGRWVYGQDATDPITGVPLAIIWLIEILLMCVPAISVATKKAKDLNNWTPVLEERREYNASRGVSYENINTPGGSMMESVGRSNYNVPTAGLVEDTESEPEQAGSGMQSVSYNNDDDDLD